MTRYNLHFWFEHGGFCIWGKNDKAKRKYGYAIKNDTLPISIDLLTELNDLQEEYATYLDWNYPPNPSPWTKEHKEDFLSRANLVYEKLANELGSDFVIENRVSQCVK